MKRINISTKTHPNTFTMVDDCDHQRLNRYKWYAVRQFNCLYAIRSFWRNGRQMTVRMHRFITDAKSGQIIDHRDGDGLNNTRGNLRQCSKSQNAMNSRIRNTNKSGFKGVCWHKRINKWYAQIQVKGKKVHLGYFTCIMKASKAYIAAAKKYHGEFAKVNF